MDADSPNRTYDLIFYDADCGFCSRWVQVVLRLDTAGRFHFAPLDGETYGRLAQPPDGPLAPLAHDGRPESVVVLTQNDQILTHSDAALHVGQSLGSAHRLLAEAGWLVPKPIRDTAYQGVARARGTLSRLLAPTPCPVPTPEQRTRFHP